MLGVLSRAMLLAPDSGVFWPRVTPSVAASSDWTRFVALPSIAIEAGVSPVGWAVFSAVSSGGDDDRERAQDS